MSEAVQSTFLESVTRSKQRELAALRCPDRYYLELRMDDGSYRRLDELSGGQRVSVLLSLLLETEDSRRLSSTNRRTSSTTGSCSRRYCLLLKS